MNAAIAERTLIAAECIGDGRLFIDRVTAYTKDRVIFGRAIAQNQGVQFPIAEAHIEIEAADLMRWQEPISTNLILSHVAEHVLGLPRSF